LPGLTPGPLALVGSGEYLPVMADVEGLLLAGRPDRYVQIPTAAAPEGEQSLRYWHDLGAAQADRLGVHQVPVVARDREEADDPALAALVAGAGLIYLSGGNPVYLAQTLRGTRLWQAVVAAWQGGAALAGCSAGAMALTGWVPSLRELDRAADPGLGILPHLRVLPHFDRMLGWVPPLLDHALAGTPAGTTVVGIDEETALVDLTGAGHTWQVHGRQQVWTLDGHRDGHPAGAEVIALSGQPADDSGMDQDHRTEWAKSQDAAVKAEILRDAEQAERASRGKRLEQVGHDFTVRAGELNARSDALIERINDRGGTERAASLAQAAAEISAINDFLAEHEEAAGQAGGDLLHDEVAEQVGRFRGAADGRLERLRQISEWLQRQERLEKGHIDRVPELARETLSGMVRTMVTNVVRTVGIVAASHVVDGHGGVVIRATEGLMKALDSVRPLDAGHAAIKIGVPVLVGAGVFSLNLGLVYPDAEGYPRVDVVEEPEPARGQEQPLDRTEPKDRRGTGLVIWGSARDIAAEAESPILDGGTLLSWARKRAFRKLYGGRPGSAAAAMRVTRDLEVVLLLDPGVGGGLWVDVDPVTQLPATTLLVEMTVDEDCVARFRVFRS
jgi:cyanophycinase